MKHVPMWVALAMIVFTANGQDLQSPVVHVKAYVPTFLYGGQASKLEGDLKKQGGDNFSWKGGGRATWEVQVDKSGEYAVGLCHAAEPSAAGQELQITSGGSRLRYALRITKGVFPDNMAYELVPLTGSLTLAAGKQNITPSPSNAAAGKNILPFPRLAPDPAA